MASSAPSGSKRILTFRGIDVFVHWSWLVIGILEIQWRADVYGSPLWNVLEYIALFGIVLLHEFGHALACRSVGGTAEHIMLWPLGGVAYVRPPQRPGAMLWSIAAGPLVNLVLGLLGLGLMLTLKAAMPALPVDLENALITFIAINGVLFAFNMLPIYPLDGGQVLRSLLWFVIGRERSLTVAASIGLVASVIAGASAVFVFQDLWLGAIAAYAAWRSWNALKTARATSAILALPRSEVARCPSCGEHPPQGPLWRCANQHAYDIFAAGGACPLCGDEAEVSPCIHCGKVNAVEDFLAGSGEVPQPRGS